MFEGCRPASPPSLAGPRRPRPDQPDAGARGVEVHLVVGGVERVDVLAGEELRRRVRALGDADLPGVGQVRPTLGRGRAGDPAQRRAVGQRRVRGVRRPVSPAAARRPAGRARPPWPPKPPRVKVEPLPRYVGTSRPPRTATASAQPGPLGRADRERRPGGDVDRLPHRHRLAVDGDRGRRAGDAHDRRGAENRSVGPVAVTSRPGAPAGLPTARLASRSEAGPSGRDGGTPTCQ